MIINKKSPEILKYRRYGTGADSFLRVYDTRMYFTSTAAEMCDMKIGYYAHFVNDEKDWSFYVDDDKDGFIISEGQDGRNKGNIKAKNICDVGLIRMFRATTGFSHDMSFNIEKTNALHDGCPLFKINTEKPII